MSNDTESNASYIDGLALIIIARFEETLEGQISEAFAATVNCKLLLN